MLNGFVEGFNVESLSSIMGFKCKQGEKVKFQEDAGVEVKGAVVKLNKLSQENLNIKETYQVGNDSEVTLEKVVLESTGIEKENKCEGRDASPAVKSLGKEKLSEGSRVVKSENDIVPLEDLCKDSYFMIESSKSELQKMVSLFERIEVSGMPNFQGCRVSLPYSKLNISAWRTRLRDYHDNIVCDFLQYGFPIDFDRKRTVSDSERRNHRGARNYPEFIDKYLRKETSAHRIIGPFDSNPLSVPLIVSPMNTVPKANEDERRVIFDLSWPHGASVNDGISKTKYLGELINLHYASVEQVCQMVMRVGKGAHIYKRDLRQAYRQIPVDPRDYRYLGFFWKDSFYFDTTLAMGQRNAAMACSRTTDAIMYMHAQDGYEGTNYLDDLIGVSHPCYSDQAFDALGQLLMELGLEENLSKACAPATSQVVLGILINTIEGTLSVPDEKLGEIVLLVQEWQGRTSTKKVELQSLIGKLQFITKCVRQSRIFMNRLLETLRAMNKKKRISLSSSFQKDLRWWSLFMERFNGVSFIPPTVWAEPDVTFSTDSCLQGCGGICGLEYFHTSFPSFIRDQQLPIHKLEMLAVLIGVRIWGKRLQGLRLQIFCDNSAAVDVINSSKTRDPFFASCLRELWLEVSTYCFELRAVHLPGEENRIADWLSRWGVHRRYQDQFHQFISEDRDRYIDIPIAPGMFEFSNEL